MVWSHCDWRMQLNKMELNEIKQNETKKKWTNRNERTKKRHPLLTFIPLKKEKEKDDARKISIVVKMLIREAKVNERDPDGGGCQERWQLVVVNSSHRCWHNRFRWNSRECVRVREGTLLSRVQSRQHAHSRRRKSTRGRPGSELRQTTWGPTNPDSVHLLLLFPADPCERRRK